MDGLFDFTKNPSTQYDNPAATAFKRYLCNVVQRAHLQ